MAKALVYDIVVSEFELQSFHLVHFRIDTIEKVINTFIPTNYLLKSTTSVFFEDSFGIK